MLKRLERAMRWERRLLVRHVYVPNVYRIIVRESACVMPSGLWESFCRSAESELRHVARDEQWRVFCKDVIVIIEATDDIREPAMTVKTEFRECDLKTTGFTACGSWELLLHGDRIVIGREDADILIKDADHRVSRHHACIFRTGAGYEVRDESSANGTFVNGVPLFGPRLLESGDTVRFADKEFIFMLVDDQARLIGEPEGILTS